MKQADTITLELNCSQFTHWRQTRKYGKEKLPRHLEELISRSFDQFSTKEIVKATGLRVEKINCIKAEYLCHEISIKQSSQNSISQPPIQFSEIEMNFIEKPLVTKVGKQSTPLFEARLVASIDDSLGRTLKLFGNSSEIPLLIRSFLNNGRDSI